MLSDEEKAEIIELIRKENAQLTENKEIEIVEDIEKEAQSNVILHCFGKIKEFIVWGAINGTRIICYISAAIGTYDVFQIGSEIYAPGSVPDLRIVAHDLGDYLNGPKQIGRPVLKAAETDRYIAFKDQWLSSNDDAELKKTTQDLSDDEKYWTNLNLVPESSGIIDNSIYNSGHGIAYSEASENRTDGYPRVIIQDSTPPPSSGNQGADYA